MNPLHEIISNDIRKNGFIPFDEFMNLALYCPVYGYYEGEADKIGQAGDFYTSVSVGGLFGDLLGFQFAGWLEELRKTGEASFSRADFKIIEVGAYDGRLAHDILCWIQTARGELWDEFVYCIVEPSAALRGKQEERLSGFGAKVRWVSRIEELSVEKSNGQARGVRGVIFSNELLDAMPVRRIGWDAKAQRWFEWAVALKDENYVWTKIYEPKIPIPEPEIPDKLREILPDGFTTEVGSAAVNWWRKAAELLEQGKLVAIDYGLSNEEFIVPQRKEGTLRTYSNHKSNGDLLSNPGERDITAHVNFTAIQSVGEAVGLKTEAFISQEKFLIELARQTLEPSSGFGEWTAARRRQFQTLTHPEHLGRPFRVLIQSRSAAGAVSS